MKAFTIVFVAWAFFFFILLSFVSANPVAANAPKLADSTASRKILGHGTHTLKTTRGVDIDVSVKAIDADKNCAVGKVEGQACDTVFSLVSISFLPTSKRLTVGHLILVSVILNQD
jgi:hypothetical protein